MKYREEAPLFYKQTSTNFSFFIYICNNLTTKAESMAMLLLKTAQVVFGWLDVTYHVTLCHHH